MKCFQQQSVLTVLVAQALSAGLVSIVGGEVLAQDSVQISPAERERVGLIRLLAYLHLQESDFGFRDDYMPPDSFSLIRFNELNRDPLSLTEYVSTYAQAARTDVERLISQSIKESTAQWQVGSGKVVETDPMVTSGFTLYYASADFNSFLIALYLATEITLPAATDSVLARLTESERRFVRNKLPELILEDELAHERDVFKHDSIQQAEKIDLREFVGFGTKLRPEFLIKQGGDAVAEIIHALEQLMLSVSEGETTIRGLLSTDVIRSRRSTIETHLGLHDGWKISGAGNDTHKGNFRVLIDIGGDDTYELNYDPGNPHPQIIIDLGGNDTYIAKSPHTLGASMFSLGLLIDWSGNDRYLAENFALGSGFCGVGVLYDREGDDYYEGDTFVQGAGGFGMGLALDQSGHDIYKAAFCSQAFGFTKGIGLLVDWLGDDSYTVGGKYSDVLRYDNHYLTLSQGFGYGMRPFLSGGIGGMIDFSGNDKYIADIFGQGASYWRSVGFIYDEQGNDSFQAYQYAQGAGTHMTLAALVDEAGDDVYQSKGVSQGCGHDYSYGILSDRAGNDKYHADDLSQGAGSANGVGFLSDVAGDDQYFVEDSINTHGYGNPRREFGSIGLLLDLDGSDAYTGLGADNTIWRAHGKWGGGMDWNWIDFPKTADTSVVYLER